MNKEIKNIAIESLRKKVLLNAMYKSGYKIDRRKRDRQLLNDNGKD